MKIKFNISDDKIVNFSCGAKAELTQQANRIAEEIVDEASRIEASRRISDTTSEVTQSNVKEAATQPRMIFTKKKSWASKIIQIIAFVSSLVTGGLFDLDKFKEGSHVIMCFIVVLFIATATNVYLIFNQENNG